METMEKIFRCADCVMFEDEDAEGPAWCLAKDMYTFVKGTDMASRSASGYFAMRSSGRV